MPQPIIQSVLVRAIADALIPDEDPLEAGARENSLLDWSKWAPERSSAIRQVNHRLRDGMMTVRFNKPQAYPDYLFVNVPRELFKQWKRVVSPGKFYHRRIKGQYSVA